MVSCVYDDVLCSPPSAQIALSRALSLTADDDAEVQRRRINNNNNNNNLVAADGNKFLSVVVKLPPRRRLNDIYRRNKSSTPPSVFRRCLCSGTSPLDFYWSPRYGIVVVMFGWRNKKKIKTLTTNGIIESEVVVAVVLSIYIYI